MRPCSPVPPCSPYFLGGGEAKSKTSLLYETGEHGGTGEQTLTRAKLRDHNRKHDVVDVGNDPAFNDPARQGKAYEPGTAFCVIVKKTGPRMAGTGD